MKINRITCARRTLPLKQPLTTAGGVMTARETIILAVQTNDATGIGEAAPLPEHGTETFDDAWTAARRLAAQRNLPECEGIDSWLNAALPDRVRIPCLSFGVGCAVAAVFPVAALALFGGDRRVLPVNALIGADRAEALLAAIEIATASGYETVKLKVGVNEIAADVAALEQIRARFPALRVRVDANEAWSPAQARQFFAAVRNLAVEFVEDPLRNPDADALAELRNSSAVPLALDASLRHFPALEVVLLRKLCNVLVMKPPRCGSPDALCRITGDARAAGIQVVFSSSIDSSIGISYAAALAAHGGDSALAHGLGTAALLEDDTFTVPLIPRHGLLRIPNIRDLPGLLREDLRHELQLEM